jgi:hypothetical protein
MENDTHHAKGGFHEDQESEENFPWNVQVQEFLLTIQRPGKPETIERDYESRQRG